MQVKGQSVIGPIAATLLPIAVYEWLRIIPSC